MTVEEAAAKGRARKIKQYRSTTSELTQFSVHDLRFYTQTTMPSLPAVLLRHVPDFCTGRQGIGATWRDVCPRRASAPTAAPARFATVGTPRTVAELPCHEVLPQHTPYVRPPETKHTSARAAAAPADARVDTKPPAWAPARCATAGTPRTVAELPCHQFLPQHTPYLRPPNTKYTRARAAAAPGGARVVANIQLQRSARPRAHVRGCGDTRARLRPENALTVFNTPARNPRRAGRARAGSQRAGMCRMFVSGASETNGRSQYFLPWSQGWVVPIRWNLI